jgi:hypothetical protein
MPYFSFSFPPFLYRFDVWGLRLWDEEFEGVRQMAGYLYWKILEQTKELWEGKQGAAFEFNYQLVEYVSFWGILGIY